MIKASFRLIFAALAATAALVSCTKEIAPGQVDADPKVPEYEGSRVIAVSFAPQSQTKTYLDADGLTPKFIGKEMIKVSNGTECKDCEVKVDGEGNATFTTNLEGILKAVYPATAAKMDEKTNEIVGVLVSTEQTGKFADANICMAEMTSEKDESLSFVNKTALFCITPGDGDKTKYVEVSTKNLDIANYCPTGSVYTSLKTIHVATVTADSVYVSILVPDGLTAGGLAFSDGVKVKTVTGDNATKTIAVNTFYKVTGGGWKTPQADIPGALMGVFTVSAGLDGKEGTDDDVKVHFSQGNLQATYNSSTSSYTWGFAANQYDAIGGQDEYGSGTKTGNNTIGSQTDGAVVDLFGWSTAVTTYGISAVESIDAYPGDFVDWGTAIGDTKTWRTLSNDEWEYLFNTRTMTNGKSRYSGAVKGVIIGGTSYRGIFLYPDNYNGDIVSGSMTWAQINAAGIVFLPAAGSRFGSEVTVYDEEDLQSHVGYYWTSSTNIETNAYEFHFYYDGEYNYQEVLNLDFTRGRNIGHSVRLVTNVSTAPASTEPEYVEMGGLKWATCNIGADNPTDYGWYFSWGNTTGYIYDDVKKWVKASDGTTLGLDGKFNSTSYNSTPGKDVSEDISPTSVNDAARINWGGDWRMPTKGDFAALAADGVWIWTTSYNSTLKSGYIVYVSKDNADKGKAEMKGTLMKWNGSSYDAESGALQCSYSETTDTHLFFPVAGCGNGATPYDAGARGYYLSSSWISSSGAFGLFFDSVSANLTEFERCKGFSVRPVSD